MEAINYSRLRKICPKCPAAITNAAEELEGMLEVMGSSTEIDLQVLALLVLLKKSEPLSKELDTGDLYG